MHIRTVVVLPLALLLSGCAFVYQPPTPKPTLAQLLVPGGRVRVFVPASDDYVRIASLVALTEDSIVFEQREPRSVSAPLSVAPPRVALPLGAVGRLEVSRGFHRHTLIGTLGGSLAGVFAAFVVGCSGGGSVLAISCPHPVRMGIAFASTTLLGVAIGLHQTERWEEVPMSGLQRVRVGVTPLSAGRLGLGAALSF